MAGVLNTEQIAALNEEITEQVTLSVKKGTKIQSLTTKIATATTQKATVTDEQSEIDAGIGSLLTNYATLTGVAVPDEWTDYAPIG